MIKNIGINRIIYVVMAWLCFFSPLSNNGIVNSTTVTLLRWGILLLIFTLLICINGINNNTYIISGFIIIYLLCATVAIIDKKQEFEFSIARLIPMLSAIMVCSINYKNMRDKIFLEKGLDCIIIAIVLANILIFIQNPWVLKWIGNYYTQYLPNITEYHLSLKKPLSFYGVHNQAAFIYCGLYIISNLLYRCTLKKRYKIYMIMLLFFNLLLRSTTSLGFALFMIGIYIYSNRKSKPLMILSICLVCIAILFFLQTQLFKEYLITLSHGANGFFPRYVEGLDGLYKNNIEVVKQFVLGIGFTIPNNDSIYFADSGYLIFYTMGNIVLPISFYLLFLNSLFHKAQVKEYRIYFALFAFLMELGFVSFLALKTICFYWFMYIYIKAFETEKGILGYGKKDNRFKVT